jgi:hypothetical protein
LLNKLRLCLAILRHDHVALGNPYLRAARVKRVRSDASGVTVTLSMRSRYAAEEPVGYGEPGTGKTESVRPTISN